MDSSGGTFFTLDQSDLNNDANIPIYAKNPRRPIVIRISINMLWARSKNVSDPGPLKNLGLKFMEKGILKFSGPQPKSIVLGLSSQAFNPASHAQNLVWTV